MCFLWYNSIIIKLGTIMKIKYIIDTPYEGKFIFTDARDGDQFEITHKAALYLMHRRDPSAAETFFSYRADFALRSVDQKEIFPGTNNALSELTVKA
jgi:hypothetical protein